MTWLFWGTPILGNLHIILLYMYMKESPASSARSSLEEEDEEEEDSFFFFCFFSYHKEDSIADHHVHLNGVEPDLLKSPEIDWVVKIGDKQEDDGCIISYIIYRCPI